MGGQLNRRIRKNICYAPTRRVNYDEFVRSKKPVIILGNFSLEFTKIYAEGSRFGERRGLDIDWVLLLAKMLIKSILDIFWYRSRLLFLLFVPIS
jgi:hypothetical protein